METAVQFAEASSLQRKQVGSLLSRSGLWNLFFFSFVLPYLARAVGGRGVSAIFSVIGAAGATLLPSSTSTVVANGFHLDAWRDYCSECEEREHQFVCLMCFNPTSSLQLYTLIVYRCSCCVGVPSLRPR